MLLIFRKAAAILCALLMPLSAVGCAQVAAASACASAPEPEPTAQVAATNAPAAQPMPLDANALEWEYRVGTLADKPVKSAPWTGGARPFGAKDGGANELAGGFYPATVLPQYDKTGLSLPAYSFRTTLVLDALDFDFLRAALFYDDTVRLFVNGACVFSGNLPENGFNEAGYGAAGAFDGPLSETLYLPAALFRIGKNTLTAEVHQHSDTSSDVYFDLTDLCRVPRSIEDVFLGVGSDASRAGLKFFVRGEAETASVTVSGASCRAVRVLEGDGGCYYFADIENLAAGDAYDYTITCGTLAASGTFSTGAPAAVFYVAGDPQLGCGTLSSDAQTFESTISGLSDAGFLAVLGDLADHAASAEYDAFFDAVDRSGLRLCAVPGNHDNGCDTYARRVYFPNMSAHGKTPGSGENSGDYWFCYGGALILALNSNESDARVHAQFLENALPAYRAAYGEPAWTVALMHHSLYSGALHMEEESTDRLREALVPVLQKNGVDLVLSGHDHSYARSVPIAGAEGGSTVFLTLGPSGGAKYFDADDPVSGVAVAKRLDRPCVTRISVTEDALHITTFIPETGETVDAFSLEHPPAANRK